MKSTPLSATLALVALCAGCQTTAIRSAWFDADFKGPPMRKIIVVGDFNTTTSNRVLEDELAQKLRDAGVDAVAGHAVSLAPDTTEAAFVGAVTGSGAQGLLLVGLLGVDTRTQISTTMASGGMGWGRSPWGWGGSMREPVARVQQFDLVTVETKLFDVKSRDLVWAATTESFNPRSLSQELPSFAAVVIRELTARGIIAPK